MLKPDPGGGKILSRGHGPRNQHMCLWCRGPLAPNIEILTHHGSNNQQLGRFLLTSVDLRRIGASACQILALPDV